MAYLLCGYLNDYFLVYCDCYTKFLNPQNFDKWLRELLSCYKKQQQSEPNEPTEPTGEDSGDIIEHEGHVSFVKMYPNLKIKDGDYIGWGVSSSDSKDVRTNYLSISSISMIDPLV